MVVAQEPPKPPPPANDLHIDIDIILGNPLLNRTHDLSPSGMFAWLNKSLDLSTLNPNEASITDIGDHSGWEIQTKERTDERTFHWTFPVLSRELFLQAIYNQTIQFVAHANRTWTQTPIKPINESQLITGISLRIEAFTDPKPSPPPKDPVKTSSSSFSVLRLRPFADAADIDVASHVRNIIISYTVTTTNISRESASNPLWPLGVAAAAFTVDVTFVLNPPPPADNDTAFLYAIIIGVVVCCIICVGGTMMRRCCGRNTSGYMRGNGTGGRGGTAADGLPIDGNMGSSSGGLNLNNMRSDDL